MTSPSELLALYDAQQRLIEPEHPPAGITFELVNGVMRVTGRAEGFVETAQHLEHAGFVAQEREAVLVGHTANLLAARPLPNLT